MWQRVFVPQARWQMPAYDWGHERELCKRCLHFSQRGTVMECALHSRQACIDMRYSGACGRDGLLFAEKDREKS